MGVGEAMVAVKTSTADLIYLVRYIVGGGVRLSAGHVCLSVRDFLAHTRSDNP